MIKLLKNRFHPFAHSNYRLIFFSQFFSLVGTWSHELARSWLVLDLVGTATALGTLLLSTSLPALFLALHGGAIADRKDARKLLILTKVVLAISAFFLFYICETGQIKFWMILVFGIIEGFVNSYDGPAFTSIFARTVPREDFQQALAIQSTSFHLARMAGPAFAGLIMAWKGPAYVFLFDGISYVAVIVAITRISLRPKAQRTSPSLERGIRNYIRSMGFFFDDPNKRYRQLQLFLSICLMVPMLNLVFRSYLKQKFTLSAEEFGYLFSFPALGATFGALYIMLAALKRPIKNLIFGVPLLVLFLSMVSVSKSSHVTAVIIGACGFFSYLNIASITQSLHLDTPDEYRGRLGSIITLGFTSIGPLMSFPIGIYTDLMGFERAIRDLTILFATFSLYLGYSNFLRRPKDILGSTTKTKRNPANKV